MRAWNTDLMMMKMIKLRTSQRRVSGLIHRFLRRKLKTKSYLRLIPMQTKFN